MTDTPLLNVRDLSRRYTKEGPAAVDGLSLDLAPGEILALIGPSGCGKSTTLRMIAGFETPETGSILLSGRDITDLAPEKRGIGMVFQDYALFPHMTVADNILFGAKDKSAETVKRHLQMVGLDGLGARFPDELSGGQQQRVALARSFAAAPGLILLDEPFSNLDAALRSTTRREIRALLKSAGVGILFVTHDQEEALSFADRIAVMREGRILQHGRAEDVYDRPADAFVASFLGRINLIEGEASGSIARTALGDLRLSRSASGKVMLALRPERIGIRAPDTEDRPNGRILATEFKGHDLTYWVSCHGIELQIDVMERTRLPAGTDVCVSVDGEVVPLAEN